MGVTKEQITNALKSVKYPGFSRDIVSFGLVKEIVSTDAETHVQLVLTTNDPAVPRAIKADAENVLRGLGLPEPKVLIDIHAPPGGVGSSGVGATRIPGIKHIIAIASGKGDRGCEPGACITKCRGARWSLRLRHLWPQYFAHVRFARATDGDGRKSHSADRTIRIEVNVDGISAR